jgi:hypothetical protein
MSNQNNIFYGVFSEISTDAGIITVAGGKAAATEGNGQQLVYFIMFIEALEIMAV